MNCSKGHENPDDSRFCLHCGERLDIGGNHGIQKGKTVGDRYVILRQLGQGGFGRTYLAQDIHRFRELCVLKEFSPQVQTTYVLQKAEELFEREASVLYKLQHPQIPRFRELFRNDLNGKEYLFLVQDYVEGQTYSSLLKNKKQQGLGFTEAEVRQLLQQILPVLEYIHSLGVIHRDISPDNLILGIPQASVNEGGIEEGLPVLIDFGGVKQVAATVASQYYHPGAPTPSVPPTLLGKVGYAPPEQMQTGLVEPHSDLYALAATVVVLLTGKQPQELIDTHTLAWHWEREVNVSRSFTEILNKMLSPRPRDRYQRAGQVLEALRALPVIVPPTQSTPPNSKVATVAAIPPVSPSSSGNQIWKTLLVAVVLIIAAGLVSWGVMNSIKSSSQGDTSSENKLQPKPTSSPSLTKDPSTDPKTQYSPVEQRRKEKLRDRRQQLGINYNFYVSLVNQVFYSRNPSLKERSLSNDPKDENLRAEWDKTAGELLEKLALLSANARQQLGSYSHADRDRWKAEVNKMNVGSRSLYNLGDAAFFKQFPEWRDKNFINQPIGQVWYGFVNDKLNAILASNVLEKVEFDKGATSKTVIGTLNSGDGRVFVANFAKNQLMDLKLQGNPTILLSIYSPSGKIQFLEKSQERHFSIKLPERGFYEFVLISTASEPVNYQLSIKAENITPSSSPTPTVTGTAQP